MKTSQNIQPSTEGFFTAHRTLIIFTLLFLNCSFSTAFQRYKNAGEDPGSNCSECHGDFTGDVSTKGSVFPESNKHEMHRDGNYMNSDCDLCHTSGDNRNPYIGSSNGASGEGLGCAGCHDGVGLRAHHAINNVVITNSVISGEVTCYTCHTNDVTPPAEGIDPPYYGVATDSNVDNSCNDVAAANTNENWTIGDFVGLDNDGDNLYDLADFDCGPPYHIVGIEVLEITISNEPQTLTTGIITTLSQTNVIESTVVGTDITGTTLYSEFIDYNVIPQGDLTAVERVPGGSIANGETVLVSYKTGNNVQVSWKTVGGRTDMLQASAELTNTFSDVGSSVTNSGTALLTNSVVEVGGAGNTNRFYRIRYAP